MLRSDLQHVPEFEACETEELRATGEIQAGFEMMVLGPKGVVGGTEPCVAFDTETVEAIAKAPVVGQYGAAHELLDAGLHGIWLRHRRDDLTFFEQTQVAKSAYPPEGRSLDEIAKTAHGNLWKLGAQVCNEVAEALDCARTMVYRFHEDWSGEVIAETLRGELEPFLGLHYPPTDIPKQARDLFAEIKTRHIFTTVRGTTPVLTTANPKISLDLTDAVSRSVSPYHIEYLRNMGSASTASCALMFKGKLWGLLSLHFSEERLPSFGEFAFLQDFSAEFEGVLAHTLERQEADLKRRSDRLVDKLGDALSETNDPFKTLILSDLSLQRLVGSQGICLIVDDEACSVGEVPDLSISKALCATVGRDLNPLEPVFMDKLPEDLPLEGRGDVAGCALVRLSKTPDACILLYRTALNESVSWGGDPRRLPQAEDVRRYSPRKSFEKWVENVEGRAPAWTDLSRRTLSGALDRTLKHFDVSPRELTILIRNGLKQVTRKPDLVRSTASDVINGVRTAIAVAVEAHHSNTQQIVAMNSAAAAAFSIVPSEAIGLDLDEMERLLGIDLEGISRSGMVTSLVTANDGFRDCEVTVGLLFEYVNSAEPDSGYRIQAYEFRDITEARRIEQALQSARDRALRDMELQAEFFAKMNHELRTPLNAVIGFSELLMMKTHQMPDDKARKHVTMLAQASQHLKELVNSTLGNSNAIHNLDHSSLVPTSMRQVVDETVSILSAAALAADVSILVDMPSDPTAIVDPRALRQVLINIVGNAIKYNVPGGQVEVLMEAEKNDIVTLKVVDTGIGMSEQDVVRCMQPYRRFAPGEGAGLGLSIANHMVVIMGGLITMRSTLGEGTTVRISLPRAAKADG